MKKWVFLLFILFFIVSFSLKINATETLKTDAKAFVLMESSSKRVLVDKNMHKQCPIASISKIMTAILAIENGNLNDEVTISKEASRQVGSSIYLKPNTKVLLKDLVYALMLRSGNDAAWAIGEHISGDIDNFVILMNEKAKELGMRNSTFENPHGLDETTKNISTAYDMALLTKYAMDNPLYRKISGTNAYKTHIGDNYYLWNNKHRLVKNYDYIISGKTGFTKLAKRTLVTVANKNGMELIVVTLNDSNDWLDHLNLFAYGFEYYNMIDIVKKGLFEVQELNKIFYVDENIQYPIKNNEISQYKIVIDPIDEDNKTYLYLVKDEDVIFKEEIFEYDVTHSHLEDNYNIVDLVRGIINFVREVVW